MCRMCRMCRWQMRGIYVFADAEARIIAVAVAEQNQPVLQSRRQLTLSSIS